MAFKPNYRGFRADRERLKEEKRLAKQQRRFEERVAQREHREEHEAGHVNK
jgi:hypothetical protein